MIWLVVPVITVLGMWGGQNTKAVRRYGIPLVGVLWSSFKNTHKVGRRARYLSLISLAPLLSIGYGETSKLANWCPMDWQRRLVYATLLSVPFLCFKLWFALPLLILAYQARAGGFKITKKYDFLWEDFFRYTALGLCIATLIGG